MKRIALFTVLAMGFSTVALAQPDRGGVTRPRPEVLRPPSRPDVIRPPPRPDVIRPPHDFQWNRERYIGYDNSRWRHQYRGRWTPLATGFSARTERQFIKINGQGRFRKLRIEGVRGAPVILKVAVEFLDRSSQAVEFNDRFPSGTGEVIDLNGDTRRIRRIIVYTDPNSRGAYSIYGA